MSDDAPALRSPLARAVVDYLRTSNEPTFASLDAVTMEEGVDVIDLTVEPELVQHRAVAIAPREPLRLSFFPDDPSPPAVHARREDFPLGLVHTSRGRDADGLCLCVWEESWDDLKRTLTAQALVERLRFWLAQTASGALHQAGQQVEPLLPAVSSTLVVPSGPLPRQWYLVAGEATETAAILLLDREPPETPSDTLHRFPNFGITLPPQVHTALGQRPTMLAALQEIVTGLGGDLLGPLGEWLALPAQLADNQRHPLLFVSVPLMRTEGSEPEAFELWAFRAERPLAELGSRLGRSFDEGNGRSLLRVPAGPLELDGIELTSWRVVRRLDRATARIFSGNPALADINLVGLGAGAIGSNLIANTVRAGIGTWTIVDKDIVLPHNTVRQAQTNRQVGWPKATATATLASEILDEDGHRAIDADFLAPGDKAREVDDALAAADLVVDFSASPAVLGRLADVPDRGRGASLFFSPDGNDLVLLVEDAARAVRLDELEAQYFLAATQPAMAGHLSAARIDFIRYANACQDLSRPLPPWRVQTLSGIAAGQLLGIPDNYDALAAAWRLDPATAAVTHVALPAALPARVDFGTWRGTVSSEAVQTMTRLREDALPNETGGILIGTFDVARGVVHVVAALPAPPDSAQSPTYFVRGAKALTPLVQDLAKRSGHALAYVGEWHSHPEGVAARPSADDETIFAHLARLIGPTGAPHIMAICNREELWLRGGWRPHALGQGVIALA